MLFLFTYLSSSFFCGSITFDTGGSTHTRWEFIDFLELFFLFFFRLSVVSRSLHSVICNRTRRLEVQFHWRGNRGKDVYTGVETSKCANISVCRLRLILLFVFIINIIFIVFILFVLIITILFIVFSTFVVVVFALFLFFVVVFCFCLSLFRFLLPIWSPQGSAILVHSSGTKSRKGLARDVFLILFFPHILALFLTTLPVVHKRLHPQSCFRSYQTSNFI